MDRSPRCVTPNIEHRTSNTERRTRILLRRGYGGQGGRGRKVEGGLRKASNFAEASMDRSPRCVTPNTEHRTSNTEHRTSNTEHRTSNIEHRTQNVERGSSFAEAMEDREGRGPKRRRLKTRSQKTNIDSTSVEKPFILMVPTEGVEPTHPYGYQILSLARLPIPPRRHVTIEYILSAAEVNKFQRA